MTSGPADPTTKWVDVTPKLASQWLERNTNNRTPKESKIEQYARDMEHGKWMTTGDAIRFDWTGKLIDGQNRLFAVIKSNTTVRMLTITDLPPRAQDAIDQGVSRTVADILIMRNYKNANVLASAARMLERWETLGPTDFYTGKAAQSHAEILSIIDKHPGLADAAALGQHYNSIQAPNAILAFAIYQLEKIDKKLSVEFFERLSDGANLPPGSPILALRSRLYQIGRNQQGIPRPAYVSLLFRAWNAFRQGRAVNQLPAMIGTSIPKVTPI